MINNIYKNYEIGSEFWNIPYSNEKNNCFPKDARWFMSGRHALDYLLSDILKKYKIKKVAIPSWCCDSMIIPFLKKGLETCFYSVNFKDKKMICDYSTVDNADLTLLIDYFGYTSQINIGEPKGILIRDLTHSIFSRKYNDADYYFGSLRKWAGFYTGGFGFKNGHWIEKNYKCNVDYDYIRARMSAMNDKKKFVMGETNSKDYLMDFSNAEEMLDNAKACGSCNRDIEFARKIDFEFIKLQRKENAKVLLGALSEFAIFTEINEFDCPLFFPIILPQKERDRLKSELIKLKIYCPIHWPLSKWHKIREEDKKIYNNELSIVCDQRYNSKDMHYIIQCINEIL